MFELILMDSATVGARLAELLGPWLLLWFVFGPFALLGITRRDRSEVGWHDLLRVVLAGPGFWLLLIVAEIERRLERRRGLQKSKKRGGKFYG